MATRTNTRPEATQIVSPYGLKETPTPKHPQNRRALGRYEEFLTPWLGCWILGNAVAYALPTPLPWPPVISVLMMLAGIIIYTQRPVAIRGSLLLTGLLLGVLSFQVLSFQPGARDISHGSPLPRATVQGVIVEIWPDKEQAVLAVRRVNGEAASGRLLVDDAPDMPLSATVQLIGELKEPFRLPVPGTFDQRRYLRDQHITAVLKHPGRLRVLDAAPDSPTGAFLRGLAQVRDRMVGVLSSRLPSPEAGIVGGIVLGHHAVPLAQETKQQFAQTGLIHILAASGLNVGIIAGAVLGLMSWLRAGTTLQLVMAMTAVAVYALLTGLPPSIQRAAAMLELALALKLINRRLSPLPLLLIATSALLLVNPNLVGNLGFQFSVLTTLGLITMVSPLQEFLGRYITRWAAGLVLVPLIAQLWVLPLSVFHFNQLPLHSVLLNIAAILLVTPLTLLGFTISGLALINEWSAGWLTTLSLPLAKALLWLAQWGSAQSWAQWTLASPEPWAVAAMYGVLLLSAWLLHANHPLPPLRRAVIWSLSVFCIGLGLFFQHGQAWERASIISIPLSEARQAFLLKPTHSHQVMLAIPEGLGYWEGRTISDYLRHRNIHHLAALVRWPSAAGFPAGPESAGLRVIRENRVIGREISIAAGQAAETGLFAGQRLRLGNVTFGKPENDALFRLEADGLCLEGRTVPSFSSSDKPSSCLQYVERATGRAYQPATLLHRRAPVLLEASPSTVGASIRMKSL